MDAWLQLIYKNFPTPIRNEQELFEWVLRWDLTILRFIFHPIWGSVLDDGYAIYLFPIPSNFSIQSYLCKIGSFRFSIFKESFNYFRQLGRLRALRKSSNPLFNPENCQNPTHISNFVKVSYASSNIINCFGGGGLTRSTAKRPKRGINRSMKKELGKQRSYKGRPNPEDSIYHERPVVNLLAYVSPTIERCVVTKALVKLVKQIFEVSWDADLASDNTDQTIF